MLKDRAGQQNVHICVCLQLATLLPQANPTSVVTLSQSKVLHPFRFEMSTQVRGNQPVRKRSDMQGDEQSC